LGGCDEYHWGRLRAWDRVEDLIGAIEDSPEEKELVELINAVKEREREHTSEH